MLTGNERKSSNTCVSFFGKRRKCLVTAAHKIHSLNYSLFDSDASHQHTHAQMSCPLNSVWVRNVTPEFLLRHEKVTTGVSSNKSGRCESVFRIWRMCRNAFIDVSWPIGDLWFSSTTSINRLWWEIVNRLSMQVPDAEERINKNKFKIV